MDPVNDDARSEWSNVLQQHPSWPPSDAEDKQVFSAGNLLPLRAETWLSVDSRSTMSGPSPPASTATGRYGSPSSMTSYALSQAYESDHHPEITGGLVGKMKGRSHKPPSSLQEFPSRQWMDGDSRSNFTSDLRRGSAVTVDHLPREHGDVPKVNSSNRAGEAYSEEYFKDYKIRSPKFFGLGRVFMVAWAEPNAQSRASTFDLPHNPVTQGRQHVFTKVRRFIVIRQGNAYCSAIAISTYGGQGVARPKVVKGEHGIVYTGHSPPQITESEQPQHGEEPMLPFPIRIVPDHQGETLDASSRINYGKVYNVEHNTRVKHIGTVHEDYLWLLGEQFKVAWAAGFEVLLPEQADSLNAQTASLVKTLQERCGYSRDEALYEVAMSRQGRDRMPQIISRYGKQLSAESRSSLGGKYQAADNASISQRSTQALSDTMPWSLADDEIALSKESDKEKFERMYEEYNCEFSRLEKLREERNKARSLATMLLRNLLESMAMGTREAADLSAASALSEQGQDHIGARLDEWKDQMRIMHRLRRRRQRRENRMHSLLSELMTGLEKVLPNDPLSAARKKARAERAEILRLEYRMVINELSRLGEMLADLDNDYEEDLVARDFGRDQDRTPSEPDEEFEERFRERRQKIEHALDATILAAGGRRKACEEFGVNPDRDDDSSTYAESESDGSDDETLQLLDLMPDFGMTEKSAGLDVAGIEPLSIGQSAGNSPNMPRFDAGMIAGWNEHVDSVPLETPPEITSLDSLTAVNDERMVYHSRSASDTKPSSPVSLSQRILNFQLSLRSSRSAAPNRSLSQTYERANPLALDDSLARPRSATK